MMHRKFLCLLALLAVVGYQPVAGAEEVRIEHGGLTLNGELGLADGKAMKDGIVLLVHGTLAHNGMDTIKNLTAVLNERGFSTLAVNLSLGIDDRHGMYDCKVAHRHKHLDAVDEIGAWFDWLQGQGVGDVALFGHSRGGNQVARFATERGHAKLVRLVLLAPSLGGGASPAGFERTHGRPLADAMAEADAMVKAGKGDEMLKGIGLLYCPGADVAASSFVAYYTPDPRSDTSTILPEVKVPTLVVAGGKDTVVRGLPERVGPMADGKALVFGVVDDADHFFLDLFAEDVADYMEEFLSPGS